jgi:uncharacterized integral membrane protein
MADAQPSPTTTSRSPSSAPKRSKRKDGLPWVRIIVAAVCLVYGITFVSLNSRTVRIHFVFFTVSTYLWVGFLVCLVLGALLGQAFGAWRKRSAK